MAAEIATHKARILTPLLLLFMLASIRANKGSNMYHPLEALYLKYLGAGIGQIGLFYTLSQIIPLWFKFKVSKDDINQDIEAPREIN